MVEVRHTLAAHSGFSGLSLLQPVPQDDRVSPPGAALKFDPRHSSFARSEATMRAGTKTSATTTTTTLMLYPFPPEWLSVFPSSPAIPSCTCRHEKLNNPLRIECFASQRRSNLGEARPKEPLSSSATSSWQSVHLQTESESQVTAGIKGASPTLTFRRVKYRELHAHRQEGLRAAACLPLAYGPDEFTTRQLALVAGPVRGTSLARSPGRPGRGDDLRPD